MKTCCMCKTLQPLSLFNKNKRQADGLQNRCKPCDRKTTKKYRDNRDAEKYKVDQRRWTQKYKYGLSEHSFEAMLVDQGGKCPICSADLSIELGAYAVDHNHNTKEVRGILCKPCNHGLGLLKDDPTVVLAAASYLQTRGHYGGRPEGYSATTVQRL